MLTRTSETALQAMVLIAREGADGLLTPRIIAERLEASPTYMAKITGALAKAGLLHAQRGTKGGVALGKAADGISLLEIVEACQGRILGDYCQEADTPELVCAFHQAMIDLHDAIVGALAKWTLADIAVKPAPDPPLLGQVACKMGCVHKALEHARASKGSLG